MIAVTIIYPGDNRETILLAGVPREGDSIRLENGRNAETMIVDYVLWVPVSKTPEPNVHIAVKSKPKPHRR